MTSRSASSISVPSTSVASTMSSSSDGRSAKTYSAKGGDLLYSATLLTLCAARPRLICLRRTHSSSASLGPSCPVPSERTARRRLLRVARAYIGRRYGGFGDVRVSTGEDRSDGLCEFERVGVSDAVARSEHFAALQLIAARAEPTGGLAWVPARQQV